MHQDNRLVGLEQVAEHAQRGRSQLGFTPRHQHAERHQQLSQLLAVDHLHATQVHLDLPGAGVKLA